MKIPSLWNVLSAPLVIEISDILAVIRPKHLKEWNEEVEIKAYKEANRRKLEKYELINQELIESLISGETTATDEGEVVDS